MASFFKEGKYKSKDYVFPNREMVPTENKSLPEYSIAVAEAVYSMFVKGKTALTGAEYNSIETNRLYAQGKQDSGIYKDGFLGKNKTDNNAAIETDIAVNEKRRAYANIDYTIMSPAPRLRAKLIGTMGDFIHKVRLDAIDPKSGAEKEDLKWGSYAEKKYGEKLKVLRGLAGIPSPELSYIPDNLEELELFSAEGGFKLSYESVMEDLLKYSFDYSGFNDNLVDRCLGDLLENGYVILKDVYDPSTCKVKAVYCDISAAGVQFNKQDEYRNADYGFDLEFRKISDIRQYVKKEEEYKLFQLAKLFTGQFGNNNDNWAADDYTQYQHTYGYAYDDYTIPVFNVAWIDVEYDDEIKHTNKRGRVRTYPVKGNKKKGKRDELIRTRRKMLYQCSWVIDTDITLSHGLAPNQARDGLSNPALPYHCVKLPCAPIIPQIRPALDQFMFSWIKFQQAVSMATIDGYSVDIGSISNLSLGRKKLSPLEVLRHWRQTGILFRKDTNVIGKISVSGAAIQRMEGGAGKIFQESLNGMAHAMTLIEQVTGISEVSLGATPNPNQGKATTEYAIAGTNDILKNIIKRMNMLKSDTAKGMCLRLQYVVSNIDRARKGYEGVVGRDRLELLKIAEGNDVKYGFTTKARPSVQEKRDLLEMISLSLKNGRDGKVGITEADAVRFRAMIENDASLERVSLMLAHANKKAQEASEARAAAAQKRQAEFDTMVAQSKTIEAQKTAVIETQKSVTIDKNKAKMDAGLEAVKSGKMTYEEFTLKVLNEPLVKPNQAPPQRDAVLEEGSGIAANNNQEGIVGEASQEGF